MSFKNVGNLRLLLFSMEQMLLNETDVSLTSSFAFYWRKRGIKVQS